MCQTPELANVIIGIFIIIINKQNPFTIQIDNREVAMSLECNF